jgi:mannose-6-phosphate isomerase-like protein (cupin superfamily)
MELIKRDECQPFITKDTSEIRELMAYRNSSCVGISLAEATLYPGKCTERHHHPKTEEIYYILSGEGKILVGEDVSEIRAGDTVLMPPGTPHQTWNTGEDKLVFLCVCTPAYEHEDTVLTD